MAQLKRTPLLSIQSDICSVDIRRYDRAMREQDMKVE